MTVLSQAGAAAGAIRLTALYRFIDKPQLLSRFFVAERRLILARRFNAGYGKKNLRVALATPEFNRR